MANHGPPAPILLLMHPDEGHVFDLYLEEILLTEGYNCYHRVTSPGELSAEELAQHALVIVSSGATHAIEMDAIEQYASAGGKVIVLKPPHDWGPMFGLAKVGETYSVALDAYVSVNTGHPWMHDFPEPDLQCLGEDDIYANQDAETLVYTAGQLGERSVFPAVALKRIGRGAGVVFTYDLAESLVLTHQGRAENASTGPDPDANRDGKFAPDDALEGMRDFRLRHVPQADLHQDILVRAIVGFTSDGPPLPRLWHFPRSAPAVFFVNGDGDAMVWDDLTCTLAMAEEFGVKYTLYMMAEQIDAFSPAEVEGVRQHGHDFGPHPWVGLKPSVEEWKAEIRGIVSRFKAKFGFQPTSLRSHCIIFPGWDESPQIFADNGLRLDTNFAGGYRYVSGYMNGSALPVKFMGRDGQVIDCYEQSTIQTEDGACTPKCLLPVASEDDAIELSRGLIRRSAEVYHGVYHPYFHPLNLAGRGKVSCQRWFRGVCQATRDHGMPSVSGDEWIRFNDARRAVKINAVAWSPAAGELRFRIEAPLPVSGLTVVLPRWSGRSPTSATIAGEPAHIATVPYEKLGWTALELDLRSGEGVEVVVQYGEGGGG